MKKYLIFVLFLFTSSVSAFGYNVYSPTKLDTRFSQNLSEYKDTLVSWDFSAEYIPNSYDITKSDSIKVYIRDNVYNIPWVFVKSNSWLISTWTLSEEIDINSLFDTLYKTGATLNQISTPFIDKYNLLSNSKDYLYQKDEEWIKCFNNEILKDSKTQKSYAWSKCLDIFDWFVWFSPNWDYLLYKVSNWFKIYKTIMVNVKTWVKTVVMDSPKFYGFVWSKENKQFVYGWGSDVIWRQGLYISEKWNYGETIKVLNDYIDSGYIEWDYIYVNTHNYNWVYDTTWYLMFTNLKYYYKVVSVKTWDVVYSEELK